jgi:hypothetical protein
MSEPSRMEKNVFGFDVRLHPITGMPIEQGSGALPDDEQALLHCDAIEKAHGRELADAMRWKLDSVWEEIQAEHPEWSSEWVAQERRRRQRAQQHTGA